VERHLINAEADVQATENRNRETLTLVYNHNQVPQDAGNREMQKKNKEEKTDRIKNKCA